MLATFKHLIKRAVFNFKNPLNRATYRTLPNGTLRTLPNGTIRHV